MTELTLILITITASLLEANIDARKPNPEHTISAIIRALVSFALSWAVLDNLITFPIIMLVTYWIVFDIAYNIFSKKIDSAFYIGRTAKIDRLARKVAGSNGAVYALYKVFILVFFCVIYFKG